MANIKNPWIIMMLAGLVAAALGAFVIYDLVALILVLLGAGYSALMVNFYHTFIKEGNND